MILLPTKGTHISCFNAKGWDGNAGGETEAQLEGDMAFKIQKMYNHSIRHIMYPATRKSLLFPKHAFDRLDGWFSHDVFIASTGSIGANLSSPANEIFVHNLSHQANHAKRAFAHFH